MLRSHSERRPLSKFKSQIPNLREKRIQNHVFVHLLPFCSWLTNERKKYLKWLFRGHFNDHLRRNYKSREKSTTVFKTDEKNKSRKGSSLSMAQEKLEIREISISQKHKYLNNGK